MNNLLKQTFEDFKEEYGYNEVNIIYNDKLSSSNNNNDDDIEYFDSEENFYLSISDSEISNELIEELLDNFESLHGDLIDSERKEIQDMMIEYYDFLKF
jgi:hypothetical protein